MATSPLSTAGRTGQALPAARVSARTWALAALVCVALLQLHLVFAKSFNWDEFYHFGQIYEAREGRLAQVLQTFHARLLGWVPLVGGDAIDRMQAARLELWAAGLGIAATIWGTARRFASNEAAILAALAWMSAGYAFLHSFSIRPDTIAALALIIALWLIGTKRLGPIGAIATGALVAVATICTIKSAFYLPAFAAMAWLRWSEDGEGRGIVRFAVIAALSCAVAFALLYAWHSPAANPVGDAASGAVVGDSATRMFAGGLFPRVGFLLQQMVFAPVFVLVAILGPRALAERELAPGRGIVLAGLALPLASVAIYENSFPYFYAFILPPVAVAMAPALEALAARFGVPAIAGAMLLNAAVLDVLEPKDVIERQRIYVNGVAEVFPEPVWYFDEAGMIGTHRHTTTWMTSGWGLKKYHARGVPEMTRFAQTHVVPFALAKGNPIEAALLGKRTDERFLAPDEAMIRANYIEHWGRLFVAGKHVPAGASPTWIDVMVPGLYTVESAPLIIDGRSLAPGQSIVLGRGRHAIGGDRTDRSTLRWGNRLTVPATPFPSGSLFTRY